MYLKKQEIICFHYSYKHKLLTLFWFYRCPMDNKLVKWKEPTSSSVLLWVSVNMWVHTI